MWSWEERHTVGSDERAVPIGSSSPLNCVSSPQIQRVYKWRYIEGHTKPNARGTVVTPVLVQNIPPWLTESFNQQEVPLSPD